MEMDGYAKEVKHPTRISFWGFYVECCYICAQDFNIQKSICCHYKCLHEMVWVNGHDIMF